jgi:hypothetical protein
VANQSGVIARHYRPVHVVEEGWEDVSSDLTSSAGQAHHQGNRGKEGAKGRQQP